MKPLDHHTKKYNLQKDNIIEAASWLFRRKGYVKTSINDIASRAGVNKATIFYYFTKKEHLLYEILCESINKVIEAVRPIHDSSISSQDKLESAIKGHLKFLVRNSTGGISILEQRSLTPKLRKSYMALRDEYELLFSDIVREAMDAGFIKQGDVKLETRLILSLMNSTISWFKPSGSLSIEDVGNEICRLVILDGCRS